MGRMMRYTAPVNKGAVQQSVLDMGDTNSAYRHIVQVISVLPCTIGRSDISVAYFFGVFVDPEIVKLLHGENLRQVIGTVLDMMKVYDDLDSFIENVGYDVRCFGYDPYNAKDFVERWARENGDYGIEKVIQGAKTESVPLGELKKLSEQRKLLFDEQLMQFAMGNCITLEDTNGNRKLLKQRYDQKIDAVAAMMDAYVAYKLNRDAFE